MKKKGFLLILLTGVTFMAQSQYSWDLRKCVEYALANNISVKQADIQARRDALMLEQAKLYQYPSLSLSTNTGMNSGRSIDPTTNQFTQQQLMSAGLNIQTGVSVFNWFSVKNNIAASQYQAEAGKATVDKIKNDIALNVASGYLLVLVAQEQINISRVAVQQTGQNLENTRKRVEAGSLPELNLMEIEAQLARDSSNLIAAEASLQQNILNLKAILNLDAAEKFDVLMPPIDQIPVESLMDLQPEIVYSLALINLPQQRVNDLAIKSAKKMLEVSRAQMYPTLSLYGGLGTNYANNKIPKIITSPTGVFQNTGAKVTVGGSEYNVVAPTYNTVISTYQKKFGTQFSDNFRENVGIALSVPLFNNGNARTGWKRNKLNVESMELQKEQGERSLKQDIYKAYNDATMAVQKYNASLKTVSSTEKAYSFAEKRYDLGLLSTIDFLTNQNNLTRAKLESVLAKVDFIFRLKLLEFYKGKGIKL